MQLPNFKVKSKQFGNGFHCKNSNLHLISVFYDKHFTIFFSLPVRTGGLRSTLYKINLLILDCIFLAPS